MLLFDAKGSFLFASFLHAYRPILGPVRLATVLMSQIAISKHVSSSHKKTQRGRFVLRQNILY